MSADLIRFSWTGRIPSTNEWTRIRNGRPYKTRAYQDYINNIALTLIEAARGKRFKGRVDISFVVALWKMRDTDNIIKPTIDAIAASGVIANDRLVRNITVTREYTMRDDPSRIAGEIREGAHAATS